MKNASIAAALLETGAVKVSLSEPFIWTSGIKSPVYCDNRMLFSHVEVRDFIVEMMVIKVMQLSWRPEVIIGTAAAGIPWAAFLAERLKKPMLYVRTEAKEYGSKKRIEGDVEYLRGKRALVIEDLVSTGQSSISVSKAIEEEMGSPVLAVLSIFTYGFPETYANFEEAQIEFQSLSNFSKVLDLMHENFSGHQIEAIKQFIQNPKAWMN